MKTYLAPWVLAGVVVCQSVVAADAFVVKDIRVEGLQRISAGTVFNYLPIKVGDSVTEDSSRDAIHVLFKTGFFKDVRLERSGDVLVVMVEERASIDNIKINGTKEIDEETLKKGLKEVGFAEGRIFDSSMLDKTEQELKRQYFARGYYAVQVKTTVTPLERNRVGINIDVSEGRIARIAEINVIGNQAFNDKQLTDTFSLGTTGLFSFLSKNDQYSKQKLSADLESLRSYYQNRGYLEFTINSTQVSISPDKESIYVTVNITEGARYTISGYKLAGKLIVPEEELRALIHIQPGDVFSRQEVTESSKHISARLGNDGYAFANVNAVPEVDKQAGSVAFTFFIDPGQRAYVRRINFTGNLSTRDEVLRRELRQLEGAWYSAQKVQRSRERLMRLGFFEEVTVETPPVPGVPDQVDINVTVKERLVNNFLASVGYSDVDGLILAASVTMKNLFGTGKEFSTSVDTSSSNKHLNFSFINPYYTLDGVSRSFNVYYTKIDAAEADLAAYNTNTAGASILYGIPISEDRSISLGFGYEGVTIEVPIGGAQVAKDFVATYGESNNAIKATFGWAHDSLDNPVFPSRGTLHRVTAEVALPGGDLEYYKLTYTAATYIPLSKDFSFKLKGEFGYGNGYGDTGELPFFKNYFAGGATSVRGYQSRSLGPTDIGGPDPTLPIGGSSRVLGNMEFLFPVPGASDNKSMRLSAFVDAGMVYGPKEDIDFGALRYGAGLAFHWYSPLGPLSLSVASALNKEPGDKTESVQFTLGTLFR